MQKIILIKLVIFIIGLPIMEFQCQVFTANETIFGINVDYFFPHDHSLQNTFFSPSDFKQEGMRIDSIILKNEYNMKQKFSYKYGSEGKIKEFLIQDFLNGWFNSTLVKLSYNNEGNKTQIIFYSYNNGKWFISRKQIIAYNDVGKISMTLFSEFVGNELINKSRVKYTYTQPDNLMIQTSETWQNEQWNYTLKISYDYFNETQYDAIFREQWDDGKWIKDTYSIYNYNSEFQLSSSTTFKWSNGTWENLFQSNLSYNKNQSEVVTYFEYWIIDTWKVFERSIAYLDPQGYKLREVHQIKQDTSWFPFSGPIVLNNPDGYTEHFLGCELLVYYQKPTSTEYEYSISEFNQLYQNYPNPFNPITNISYKIENDGYVRLMVYNALGEKVVQLVDEYQTRGTYKVNFSAFNLSSGVYFYEIKVNEFRDMKKMILLR